MTPACDQLARPHGGGGGAGGGERVVDQAGGPLGEAGQHGQHDRRRVPLGRRGARLRADHQSDVEQHRHQRLHGEDRQEGADQPGEAHHGDDDPGHQRVPDPAAHLLPAGVADVHGGREGRAEERADDRPDAVGGEHLTDRVPVARGGRRLHVAHAFGEVVDAQRNRGRQQRGDVAQPVEHLAAGDRQVQRELAERLGHRRGFEDVGPAGEHGEPADGGRDADGEQADRRVPSGIRREPSQPTRMNANATSPIHGACHICAAGRMEMNAIEIPASEPSIAARGVHRRIHGPTSAPQQHDHADDERPGQPGPPGLDRVTRAQLHRQHHHEDDDEHVRHRRAVGQGGHVRPALAPGQPAGQDRVPDVAQRQRDAQGRQDPAVHGVVGQADDAQAEPGDARSR